MRSRTKSGSSIIETAAFLLVLIPILGGLCLLFGMGFGASLHSYQRMQMQHAAELGARQFRDGLQSSEWLGSPVRTFFPASGALPLNPINSQTVTDAIRRDLNAMGLRGDQAQITFDETPIDDGSTGINAQLRLAKVDIRIDDLPNVPLYYHFFPDHKNMVESASSLVGSEAPPVVLTADYQNGQTLVIPSFGAVSSSLGAPVASTINGYHFSTTWTASPTTWINGRGYSTQEIAP